MREAARGTVAEGRRDRNISGRDAWFRCTQYHLAGMRSDVTMFFAEALVRPNEGEVCSADLFCCLLNTRSDKGAIIYYQEQYAAV